MSRRLSTPYSTKSNLIEAEIETALRAEKERIGEEIRRYPHPIPACDAQFNYLIEQRDQVKKALNQLHTMTANGRVNVETLNTFIDKSTMLNSDVKDAWRLGDG